MTDVGNTPTLSAIEEDCSNPLVGVDHAFKFLEHPSCIWLEVNCIGRWMMGLVVERAKAISHTPGYDSTRCYFAIQHFMVLWPGTNSEL